MTNKALEEALKMRASDSHFKVYYRSSRYFKINECWYFHTRENANVGPFDSEAGAIIAANNYLRFLGATKEEAPCEID